MDAIPPSYLDHLSQEAGIQMGLIKLKLTSIATEFPISIAASNKEYESSNIKAQKTLDATQLNRGKIGKISPIFKLLDFTQNISSNF